MEGSVRRNIALKLKEPAAPTSTSPVPPPPPSPPSSSTQVPIDIPAPITTGGFPLHQGKELRWDQRLNLIGRSVLDPLLHICEVCDFPILIYGRMKRCRHAFCRDCAKKAGGVCPRCHEADQTFEEASMGSVHVCTHGGGRYNNKGCGRSYLSQRDLDAHIAYRHVDKSSLPTVLTNTALPPLTISPFFPPPPPPPPPPGGGPGDLSGQSSALPSFPHPPMFTVPTSATNWPPRPPGFS